MTAGRFRSRWRANEEVGKLRAEVERLVGLAGCCMDECPAKAEVERLRAQADGLAEAGNAVVDAQEASYVDDDELASCACAKCEAVRTAHADWRAALAELTEGGAK
jgi:hypothetical protein